MEYNGKIGNYRAERLLDRNHEFELNARAARNCTRSEKLASVRMTDSLLPILLQLAFPRAAIAHPPICY